MPDQVKASVFEKQCINFFQEKDATRRKVLKNKNIDLLCNSTNVSPKYIWINLSMGRKETLKLFKI